MFFQWRASRQGQEKFHSAMLPHGGTGTRSWHEIQALGDELRHIDEVTTARTRAKVALVWDWQNWWAVEGAAHPINTLDYRDIVTSHYRALWHQHVDIDVVTLDDDLSDYRVLVIPNQYLMTSAHTDAVRSFVQNGGHLLVSFFSGIVDEDDRVHENGYPGALRDVVGGHVRDFSPLPGDTTVIIRATAGQSLVDAAFTTAATQWQDDLIAESARVVAEYTQGYLTGQPAILEQEHGAGRAVYLGTRLDDDALETVVSGVLARAGVSPVHAAPRGVEVTERRTTTDRFLFLLNHGQDKAAVELDRSGVDLLTGRTYDSGEEILLGSAEVAVIRSDLA
jgi:beta-galactosidase